MGKGRVEVEWTTIAYAYDSFVENFEGELGQDAEHLFYRGIITALLHVQLALDKVDFNAIDDWIDEGHLVRVADLFVDKLDLPPLGFVRSAPALTGRPGYHPAALLKLFVYG